MKIKTHDKISGKLVGLPLEIVDGNRSVVELLTTNEMVVDSTGLIHGGFTFGLADYAAMLAVNHPNVVLGKAQVKFSAAVRANEVMRAEATIIKTEGIKSEVLVEVKVEDMKVFTGEFTCYKLNRHVLDDEKYK